MTEDVKVVVVGDGMVGKTSMLISYTTNSFPVDYVPTVFENYSTNVVVDNKLISLALWDTAGQEEFERLRPISYPNTDVFLVCFSITSEVSLNNVKTKWIPELQHYAPNVPILLIATKADVRDDENIVKDHETRGQQIISVHRGNQLAKDIGAAKYLECSALTQIGLKEVFEDAMRIGIEKKLVLKKSRCRIL